MGWNRRRFENCLAECVEREAAGAAFPYYPAVPKDPAENLEFREMLLDLGDSKGVWPTLIWKICERDLLFYANSFCWVFDPRKTDTGQDPVGPFLTYAFQDKAFARMLGAFGREDILIEKSRDMGASYMCLTLFEWAWHFRRMQSLLLVSRKEDMVDNRGNPDSLFWKIDFYHQNQPHWLLPPGRELGDKDPGRRSMHLENKLTGSVIDGESTTGNVGVGGRRTGILMDEFSKFEPTAGYAALAATRDNTNCRIFNSTPNGESGAFWEQREKMRREKKCLLTMHWSLHPEKAKDLYIDPAMPGTYKYRSSWYDEQCKRAAHPREIAQELDIDYLGASYQFFDSAVLEKCRKEHVRDPIRRGFVELDLMRMDATGFVEHEKGSLALWTEVGSRGRVPEDRQYVIGADIAAGSRDFAGRGASNSVAAVLDKRTGAKVAELAVHGVKPAEFAKQVFALCKFFAGLDRVNGGCLLIFEANGPGQEFRDALFDLGYRHVWYRQNDKTATKKPSDMPGWYTTRDNREALLGAYRQALKQDLFIERSAACLEEAAQYIHTMTQGVVHASGVNTIDPTGARDNHGDRVIASALAWHASKDVIQELAQVPDKIEGYDGPPPEGSLAWRRAQREQPQESYY